MAIILIPHHHPQKEGATEHVQAITAALQQQGLPDDVVLTAPVENIYRQSADGASVLDITGQISAIRDQYSQTDHKFLVVTGDYGAEAAPVFKDVLGDNSLVLMSTYTVQNKDIMAAFERRQVDYLAVPTHGIARDVFAQQSDYDLIDSQRARIIGMVAVPHTLDADKLAVKYQAWHEAAATGKLAPLPNDTANIAVVVMPGDIEGPDGRPVFFGVPEAEALADAVYADFSTRTAQSSHDTFFLVSNGPRTGKYNPDLLDDPHYAINDPRFHHADRMKDISKNPVATAFLNRLEAQAGSDHVLNGCIMAGKTPPQGFLAFYHHANQMAGGDAVVAAYIDGVSTTMLGQAANVLQQDVPIIALDSSAKNATHIAGVNALYEAGVVSILNQNGASGYSLRENQAPERVLFDDAGVVAHMITTKIIPGMYLNRTIAAWQQDRGPHVKPAPGPTP